ncbi:GTP cyclohydrolase 1 feedback regulatory protein isoform X2 [Mustelus asterias]
MPYVLISTQIRLETGPTIVGDEHSDEDLMNYLGAEKTTALGNNLMLPSSQKEAQVVWYMNFSAGVMPEIKNSGWRNCSTGSLKR